MSAERQVGGSLPMKGMIAAMNAGREATQRLLRGKRVLYLTCSRQKSLSLNQLYATIRDVTRPSVPLTEVAEPVVSTLRRSWGGAQKISLSSNSNCAELMHPDQHLTSE